MCGGTETAQWTLRVLEGFQVAETGNTRRRASGKASGETGLDHMANGLKIHIGCYEKQIELHSPGTRDFESG